MTDNELNALVAEKVMGFVKAPTPLGLAQQWQMPSQNPDIEKRKEYPYWFKPFQPSTDIAAAWQVVEKMSRDHETLTLFENRYGSVYSNGKWSAYFGINPDGAIRGAWAGDNECQEYWESPIPGHVSADTPARAICLAALKAVGQEKANG